MQSPQPNIISLIGIMGSGKSSFAEALGKYLNWDVLDLDSLIEKKHGSISEIFHKQGENVFRAIEHQELMNILQQPQKFLILSLGGGTFLSQANREAILSQSTCIWLDTPLNKIIQRLQSPKSRSQRPLLHQEDWEKALETIYEKRAPIYALAHHRFQGGQTKSKKFLESVINELNLCLKR